MARTGEDITLGQLRTFVCAARAGSFVKAADELGISQPAVSDQIGALERRLGHKLFQRRRGTTPTLTPQGQEALRESEQILLASANLFGNKAARPERVRIVIGPFLRDLYLKPLIGAIYRKFPGIDIDLLPVVPWPEALKRMEEGEVDLVLYSLADPEQASPRATKVCDVPVAFVVSPKTKAALRSGAMRLDDLEFLIPTRRDMVAERWVLQMIKDLGITPTKPPRYLDNGEMVLKIAKDGLGAAYLMLESAMAGIERGEIAALDLPLKPMSRMLALAPGANEAAQFIRDELVMIMRQAPQPAGLLGPAE